MDRTVSLFIVPFLLPCLFFNYWLVERGEKNWSSWFFCAGFHTKIETPRIRTNTCRNFEKGNQKEKRTMTFARNEKFLKDPNELT